MSSCFAERDVVPSSEVRSAEKRHSSCRHRFNRLSRLVCPSSWLGIQAPL